MPAPAPARTSAPHRTQRGAQRKPTALLTAVLLCLAGCSGATTHQAPPSTATSRDVTWLADDLLRESPTGRYFVTCEEAGRELHEKRVWITPGQAAEHVEDQPCPDGEQYGPSYLEEPDAEAKVVPVSRPAGTAPVQPGTPASAPTIPTTAGRPATSTTTPTRSTASSTAPARRR